MGFLSSLKEKFGKKKETLPTLPPLPPGPATTAELVTIENVKVKMELVLTQLDSLRVQYETLNERIKNIEKLVTEIRSYC